MITNIKRSLVVMIIAILVGSLACVNVSATYPVFTTEYEWDGYVLNITIPEVEGIEGYMELTCNVWGGDELGEVDTSFSEDVFSQKVAAGDEFSIDCKAAMLRHVQEGHDYIHVYVSLTDDDSYLWETSDVFYFLDTLVNAGKKVGQNTSVPIELAAMKGCDADTYFDWVSNTVTIAKGQAQGRGLVVFRMLRYECYYEDYSFEEPAPWFAFFKLGSTDVASDDSVWTFGRALTWKSFADDDYDIIKFTNLEAWNNSPDAFFDDYDFNNTEGVKLVDQMTYGKTASVQTGDNTNLLIYAGIGGVALIGLVVVLILQKRK